MNHTSGRVCVRACVALANFLPSLSRMANQPNLNEFKDHYLVGTMELTKKHFIICDRNGLDFFENSSNTHCQIRRVHAHTLPNTQAHTHTHAHTHIIIIYNDPSQIW